MLHTKFQDHRPFGSGDEDFFKVFTVHGHGGHLGHMTWTIWTNFRSPVPNGSGELIKQNKENMDKIVVLQMAIRTDKCF